MASWYSGWSGSGGSKYHQKYAIPTTLNLLNLKKGDKFIDIGCGVGALYPYVEKNNAEYTGIDISSQMIKIAKEKNKGNFFVADIRKVKRDGNLKKNYFTAASFIFSIQDIDDLPSAIQGASELLLSSGRLVIFMLHPAFRIPRLTGWAKDTKRGMTSRRVDRYMESGGVPLKQEIGNKSVTNIFYHRPIREYSRILSENGFVIEKIEEILSEDSKEFPHFMAIKAIKK